MEIKKLILGPLKTNCYFIINNNECVIVDPATSNDRILDFAKQNNLKINAILLTHGHFDHCYAVKSLQNKGIKVYASSFASDILKNTPRYFGVNEEKSFVVDYMVYDNQVLDIIGLKIKVLSTPGHTESCVSYLVEDNLFSGDTIFKGGSYGRCDLFSSDFEKIKYSIKQKLFLLKDNTKVYPGHGEETTIGEEKRALTDF